MVSIRKSDVKEVIDKAPTETDDYDPYLTRIVNFFSGIPTNEDLRRYYFWETINVGEREREVLAKKKRVARLTKLWKAQWFGRLEIKALDSLMSSNSKRHWDWRYIFAIIQGHRFIWWKSEKELTWVKAQQGKYISQAILDLQPCPH